MRNEVRLFGALTALGTLTGCHAYDEELLTGRASAPNGPAANAASGAAADGGASAATPSAGGRAADAVDPEPSEGFGETDNPGDVTAGGTGGPAAESGNGASAAASAGSGAAPSAAGATGAAGAAGANNHSEGNAGMSAANDAGPSAGKGSAAGSGGAGTSEAGMNRGTTTAGTGGTAGTAGAPPDPATECTLRGGRVWEANQHCYFPLDRAESWNVSRDGCANLAATLVVITSDEEQAFAATLVGATARWIGFSRFGRPDFTWISGDAVDYTHWEDAGSAVSGDAAVIIRSDTLQWSVETLAAAHGALCERF